MSRKPPPGRARAVLALIFAIFIFLRIMAKDPGDQKMQDISKLVQEGAAAFLRGVQVARGVRRDRRRPS
jgi:Na+/H+-translocating membrane pyrophosphatase